MNNNNSTIASYFIKSQIEYSRSRNTNDLPKEYSLIENRIIIASGVRGYGFTTAIANIFDPSKDVLVCHNHHLVNTFNDKLIELGKSSSKRIEFGYLTSSNYKKLMYGESSNVIGLRGRPFDDYSVVYIDASCMSIIKYMPNILSIIQSLETSIFYKYNVIYVIV